LDHRRPARSTEAVLGLGLVLALAVSAAAEEKKPAPAGDERPKLTIKWSTSSEVDNYGFWIMRGDTKDGPFKEANAKVVPGAGNSDLPRKYQFEDLNVEMGKTYYYYLDAVSTHGVREKYSPVMAKQCCDRPGEKAPEAHEVKDTPAPVKAPTATPPPAPPSQR
jgi:hypothetical protein